MNWPGVSLLLAAGAAARRLAHEDASGTTTTPAVPSGPLFSVDDAAGPCELHNGDTCVRTRASPYTSDERCTITALADVVTSEGLFDVEPAAASGQCHDYVRLPAIEGSPQRVPPTAQHI
jgi:hypothetical protein